MEERAQVRRKDWEWDEELYSLAWQLQASDELRHLQSDGPS
jgi:hypothetical protein